MHGLPLPLFAAGAVPPPLMWIGEQDVTAVTEVDFAWGEQVFEQVFVLLDNVTGSVGGSGLSVRTSSDNGTTFDSGALDYEHLMVQLGAGFYKESGRVNAFRLVPNSATWGLATSAYACHLLTVYQPYDSGQRTEMTANGGHRSNGASGEQIDQTYGWRDAVGKVNALRFFPVQGNFTGRFQAWGLVV